MLGTVQAENDDDTQAIAALNRALQADPDNAEASLCQAYYQQQQHLAHIAP